MAKNNQVKILTMIYLNRVGLVFRPLSLSLVHPCELHCRPTSDYFSEKLLDTVTDGTPCFMNNNSRSICVNGVCKVVWLGKRLMKSRGVGLDGDSSRLQLSSLLICQSWRTDSTNSFVWCRAICCSQSAGCAGEEGLLGFVHLLLTWDDLVKDWISSCRTLSPLMILSCDWGGWNLRYLHLTVDSEFITLGLHFMYVTFLPSWTMSRCCSWKDLLWNKIWYIGATD